MRLAVVSDPQVMFSDASINTVKACFSAMDADAVALCGDITEHAGAEEWDAFFAATQSYKTYDKLFLIPGNMDRPETEAGRRTFESALLRNLGYRPQTPYFTKELPACVLMGLAVEEDDDFTPLSQTQLNTLRKAAESAAQRGVPLIVIAHYLITDSIDVNWKYAWLGPQSSDIMNILNASACKVLFFTGHIHRGLIKSYGGSYAQKGNVSFFSTPSLCRPDNEHYTSDITAAGTGYMLELTDKDVSVEGYDFVNACALEGFAWQI